MHRGSSSGRQAPQHNSACNISQHVLRVSQIRQRRCEATAGRREDNLMARRKRALEVVRTDHDGEGDAWVDAARSLGGDPSGDERSTALRRHSARIAV